MPEGFHFKCLVPVAVYFFHFFQVDSGVACSCYVKDMAYLISFVNNSYVSSVMAHFIVGLDGNIPTINNNIIIIIIIIVVVVFVIFMK